MLLRATILVSNGNNIVAYNFARFAAMSSKVNKLPLETELVARGNNTSWTLGPGHQTSVGPNSVDNRNNLPPKTKLMTNFVVVQAEEAGKQQQHNNSQYLEKIIDILQSSPLLAYRQVRLTCVRDLWVVTDIFERMTRQDKERALWWKSFGRENGVTYM